MKSLEALTNTIPQKQNEMKTTTITLGVLLIALGFLYLNQCSQIKDLRSELNFEKGILKTDTVIKRDTIKIPEPYEIELPTRVVTIYEKEPSPVFENVSLVGDSIKLFNQNKDSLIVKDIFLTAYPLNPKLLNLSLSSSKLNISTMNIDGITQTNSYKLDLINYDYSYQLMGMSLKKKSFWSMSIKPYINYSYRIFNQFHDLGFGLKLNTTRFTYRVGLSGHYYPTLSNQPGYDVQLGITYNFN